MQPSPFANDWYNCLIEQFQYMMRAGTTKQRARVKEVMLEAGFSESELAKLYMQATLHVDDLPDDFEPDYNLIERMRQASGPHPLECTCPSCQSHEKR